MKVITIGRTKENNDIVVNDEKVSRNHLQMVLDDNGNYSVLDLNSTNGTYVNGQRITGEVPLKVTDELRIGNTVLPWQSYFGNNPNSGMNPPMPRKAPTPQSSISPRNPKADSPSKSKLLYVIIGAIVLLLAGGGIVWKIHHDKPIDEVVQDETPSAADNQDASGGQDEADDDEDDEGEAGYQRMIREDVERQNRQLEVENERYRRERDIAKQERDKAKQDRDKAEIETKAARQETEAARQETEAARQETDKSKQNADNYRSELDKTKEEQKHSEEMRQALKTILDGWDDKTAEEFCKSQPWQGYKRQTAKKTIRDIFSNSSNSDKEKLLKKMEDWNKKVQSKNKKKR